MFDMIAHACSGPAACPGMGCSQRITVMVLHGKPAGSMHTSLDGCLMA